MAITKINTWTKGIMVNVITPSPRACPPQIIDFTVQILVERWSDPGIALSQICLCCLANSYGHSGSSILEKTMGVSQYYCAPHSCAPSAVFEGILLSVTFIRTRVWKRIHFTFEKRCTLPCYCVTFWPFTVNCVTNMSAAHLQYAGLSWITTTLDNM